MKLYDKYKAVDLTRKAVVDALTIGPMTEGQIMEEFGMARSKANWLLNKMTKEGYLLKVMMPDATKRKIAYYKASGMEFVVRTDAEIKEFFIQRSDASLAVLNQAKEKLKPLKGGKIYNLLDRRRDWDNPKPKQAKRPVVAIASSFSLY
jgi:transposase